MQIHNLIDSPLHLKFTLFQIEFRKINCKVFQMKIRLPHSPYIANKVAIDMLNSNFIEMKEGISAVKSAVENILDEDIKKEISLEERVNEKLEENEDDIEYLNVDSRQLFWMIKRKLAPEFDVILNFEDRFNRVAHQILDKLWDDDLIDFSVNENRIKNVIYNSIIDYIDSFEKIEDEVIEKISGYKRKLIVGTEEYDIVFEKLYEEELKKRGMM